MKNEIENFIKYITNLLTYNHGVSFAIIIFLFQQLFNDQIFNDLLLRTCQGFLLQLMNTFRNGWKKKHYFLSGIVEILPV